ncbi:phosphatase 2C, partial [Coemansia sp. RSA 2705]
MGKPNPPMLECVIQKFHLDPARTCMVGDRLDTDILFGIRGGLSTLCVLTGVADEAAVLAADAPQATYYAASLGDLCQIDHRNCIPPPIDTENAGPKPAATTAAVAAAAAGIEPLVLEEEQTAEAANTECAHIGVSFSKNRRYRRTMEDAHYHKYDFDGVKGQLFVAIFDGHAGRQAAQWCGDHFADIFLELKREHSEDSIPELLNRTFIEADRRLATDVKTHSGCTAAVAFLEVKEQQRILYCANVGDARAVLSRGGTAKRLTYDHKGDDAHEIDRISEAGGYVFNGRVNGVLAVTRALGDSSMKQY